MQGLPIRRNTALLSAAMALNSATFQLVAAVSSLTFVLVTGIEGLLGLGPAIFMLSTAGGALVAGRAMDRLGRVPVIAAGFGTASVGSTLTAIGAGSDSALAIVFGFALLGTGGGAVNLSRTAAGDMYPPSRRARGIAWVLFGAVFGAILGPAVFSPIFAGREVEADALVVPWLASAGIALLGVGVALLVRPDPKRIAELISPRAEDDEPAPAAPLREILRRPGVVPALVAGLASVAVMVSVMNLTGYVVVEHRDHPQHLVFPIIGAHVVGMFGLMPVVGTVVDRVGRAPALVAGLLVIAVSCGGLQWGESVWATGVLLFGLGLGWNVSFVAATAQLVDLSAPSERGRLLGFHDFAGSIVGAAFVLLGGYALGELGVYALAAGSATAALLPVVFLLARRVPSPAPEPVKRNGRRPAPLLPSRLGGRPSALSSHDREDLERQAGRRDARVVRRRRRGPDPWATGDPDRRHAARQDEAGVHAAYRHGRLRGRRERREDPGHGEEARPEALLPALGLSGRAAQPHAARAARAAADGGAPQGGEGDAPSQPAGERAADEAEDLRGPRAPARGAGAEAAAARGLGGR